MIPVTKPFLPPKNEYFEYLGGIWDREYLTNNGPLVQQLEKNLREYLGSEHLLYMSNGTIAIQIAIKALGLTGEIITTPFSYVATTSSIVWEGCTPVFVDIDPETLNINPELIEDAITDKTSGILATHVFGNPCDIDAIQAIADKHNLKVIYDAAHCFGTKYKGESVFNYGDVSTTSFHATKLFHTVEGGAVFAKNPEIIHKLSYMRNFGHNGAVDYHGVGINGKNSEFHAAMGLCNLKYVEEVIEIRKMQVELYKTELSDNSFTDFIRIENKSEWNASYIPIIFQSEEQVISIIESLRQNDIVPRRYFYPSLDTLDYVKEGYVPISNDISKRIICLPLFHSLRKEQIQTISKIIKDSING